MIDRDLARLYEVPTKALNQAVKRNARRFPDDFIFQLTMAEKNELVTNCDRFRPLKHSSQMPHAFTEQGVAMLSSVLNSERAIEVNILIMRAFVRLRHLIAKNEGIRKAIETMEKRLDMHDRQIAVAFAALKSFLQPPVQTIKSEYTGDEKKRKEWAFLNVFQAAQHNNGMIVCGR